MRPAGGRARALLTLRMVPQEELDRALTRWKARSNGHELPVPVAPVVTVSVTPIASVSPPPEEVTQVVMSPYHGGESGNVVAEVNLDEGDFEDHTYANR
jgi:hypothetical protein